MSTFKLPDAARVKFLVRLLDDLRNIKSQTPNFDMDNLKRLGHQLKGSAATFGFALLGEIGAKLEDQVKAGNKSEIPQFINELESNATKFHSEFQTA